MPEKSVVLRSHSREERDYVRYFCVRTVWEIVSVPRTTVERRIAALNAVRRLFALDEAVIVLTRSLEKRLAVLLSVGYFSSAVVLCHVCLMVVNVNHCLVH